MVVPSSPSSGPAPGTNADALLLVTAEECEAHAAVARRLSHSGGVDARVFPLGTDAHAALAAVLARHG